MARSTRNSRVRVSGRNPHFFKVFFPHLSSEHLKIPPKFWKHVEHEESHTISLYGPSGRTWYVDLVKNSDGFFFEDGWNEFVADHSLALGDFLVFRYDGESRFTVFLFDNTACEKDEAFTATPCQDDITVLDMNAGTESVGEEASRALVVARNGSIRVTLKRKRGSDDCAALDGSLRKRRSKTATKNSQDHSSLGTVRKSTTSPHSRLGENNLNSRSLATHKGHRGRPRKENQISSELSLCKILNEKPINSKGYTKTVNKAKLNTQSGRGSSSKKSSNSGKKSALILSRKMPSKTLPLIMSSCHMDRLGEVDAKDKRQCGLISQRRSVTEEELDKAHARSNSFKSRNPFFKIEMKDAYVYRGFFMHVPNSFTKEFFPNESIKMTLWDPNGKSWEVNYISYGARGGLSAGWKKFSYAHNLEIGDVCVFELIKKYHLRVHFFRVVDEIAPLLRYWEARS